MRNLFISTILLLCASPVFPEGYVLKFDFPNSPGELSFQDNTDTRRNIRVGEGADSFDPTLCKQGLYSAHFFPDSDSGEATLVYLLIDHKLPAGFLTISCVYNDDNSFITYVDAYAKNPNLFLKYTNLVVKSGDDPVLHDKQASGFTFNSQRYQIELWRKKDGADEFIKCLMVKNNNDILEVNEINEVVYEKAPEPEEGGVFSFLSHVTSAATNILQRVDNYVTEIMNDDAGIEHLRPAAPFLEEG